MAVPRKLPPAVQLWEEYKQTDDVQTLVNKYGASRSSLYELLKRAGYDTNVHGQGTRSTCPYSHEELLKLRAAIGIKGIMQQLNVGKSVVYKWIAQAKR